MSKRQKWLAGGSTAAVVIIAVVVILLTTGGKTRLGCIDTYIPGLFGSYTLDQCGGAARATCATAKHPSVYNSQVDILIIEAACRKGGLPIG